MTKRIVELAKDRWILVSLTAKAARFKGEDTAAVVDVPLDEIGDARLHVVERGATLLRWIRRMSDGGEP